MIKTMLKLLVAWRAVGPIMTPSFHPGQEHPLRIPARTLFVGDQEFVVRQTGEGPDLVLIHGLNGSSLAEWYEVAPLLARQYRVTLVDQRNHGLSSRSPDRFEIEDAADDVAAVLAELGIGKCHVVGYSMGGAIAQALAWRHSGLTDRLVLIATFARHPSREGLVRRIGVVTTRAFERLTGLGTPEVRAGYLVLTGAVDRRNARWLWQENRRRDPDTGAAAALALLRFDSTPWVTRLRMPTLVIIPSNDLMVPPAWQYELAALLPAVRVVEIAGGRHEIPWTHPERIGAEVLGFLG